MGKWLIIGMVMVAAVPLVFLLYLGGYLAMSGSYDYVTGKRHREFDYEWQCRLFHPMTKAEQAVCGVQVVTSYRVDAKTQQMYRP